MDIKSLTGVIPPMITPFKENGDVDYDAFLLNLEKWNRSDLCGYLVLGSNSETVYLNEREKQKLIELTVTNARKGRFILAGTGSESTRQTIELTNHAGAFGAHAALVLPPYYYISKMTDEVLVTFYTEVADNADIPILIYNVSKFTHIEISAQVIGELSRHPNIIGMKDSSGNVAQLIGYQNVTAPDFNLMTGTASIWYPALKLGVSAGIMALANILPNECIEVRKQFIAGNESAAEELYRRLFPVNTAVTATYGIAGLKYAADLLGFKGGYVRKPMLMLIDNEKRALMQILSEAGVIHF
ncbi:dihydrodipicolinate synthase family protein [candidate division KSB1 bacterium]|nr:dihydrodipicolinate synthase family protein [candidate division KSB1 bacterium]